MARSKRSAPKKRAHKRAKTKRDKPVQVQVTKLPPTAPAARDEGPRLIPLPARNNPNLEPPKVKYYLELAEKVLKPRDKQ